MSTKEYQHFWICLGISARRKINIYKSIMRVVLLWGVESRLIEAAIVATTAPKNLHVWQTKSMRKQPVLNLFFLFGTPIESKVLANEKFLSNNSQKLCFHFIFNLRKRLIFLCQSFKN